MRLELTAKDRTYGMEVPWWLLAALLVVGLAWQPATAWAADRFNDVPDSNVFHDDIAWMADNGVTAGCNPPANDEFCPDDNVTREQMAAFMRRLDTRNVFTTDAQVAALVEELDARISDLEVLLDDVARGSVDGSDTLTFSGMNVRVVDGSGATDGAVNGLGNLIVGYNENGNSYPRSGSHNLVVGRGHGYSSWAGFVAGSFNQVTGAEASVSGGGFSTASGQRASVSGGSTQTASGDFASVSAGRLNVASSTYASVSGGESNTASGSRSSVSGGDSRSVTEIYDWRAGDLFATD